MISSSLWTVSAMLVILASLTSQQPTITVPKPPPPPANSTDETPSPKASFIMDSPNGPVVVTTAYFRPVERVPGKVITSPPYPMVQQPILQVPEPVLQTGFLGHAAFFQKMQQDKLTEQALVQQIQQSLQQQYAQQHQQLYLQKQQQEMQQRQFMEMIQRQQFLQQLHPFLRQHFSKLTPFTQFQLFQQYLRYRKHLEEQYLKLQNKKKEVLLPQAREKQQEQQTSN